MSLLQSSAPAPDGITGRPPRKVDAQAPVFNAAHLDHSKVRHNGGAVALDDASTDAGGSEAAFSIESDGSAAEQQHSASRVRTLQQLAWHNQYQDCQQVWKQHGVAQPAFLRSSAHADSRAAVVSQVAQCGAHSTRPRLMNVRLNKCEELTSTLRKFPLGLEQSL